MKVKKNCWCFERQTKEIACEMSFTFLKRGNLKREANSFNQHQLIHIAWISNDHSFHPSMSPILLCRLSIQNLLSPQNSYMQIFTGLVYLHWCVLFHESTRWLDFWVCPCFSNCAHHVLFILPRWFVRWEFSSFSWVLIPCVVPISFFLQMFC